MDYHSASDEIYNELCMYNDDNYVYMKKKNIIFFREFPWRV